MAYKVKKAEFLGVGAIVQLAGVASVFLLPIVIGIPSCLLLLIAGGAMARTHRCSECMNKVDKHANVCSHCGNKFMDF